MRDSFWPEFQAGSFRSRCVGSQEDIESQSILGSLSLRSSPRRLQLPGVTNASAHTIVPSYTLQRLTVVSKRTTGVPRCHGKPARAKGT